MEKPPRLQFIVPTYTTFKADQQLLLRHVPGEWSS